MKHKLIIYIYLYIYHYRYYVTFFLIERHIRLWPLFNCSYSYIFTLFIIFPLGVALRKTILIINFNELACFYYFLMHDSIALLKYIFLAAGNFFIEVFQF